MPLSEPVWWYDAGDQPDRRAQLLLPVAGVYGWLAERRFRKVEPYSSPLPVICVGNFTAGGAGKTPLAIYIAERLIELGEAPVFLSRGYKGRARGPLLVDTETHRATDVGDEPLLLAKIAPVMIARNRADGARAIAVSDTRASVIVMDDGLQNPSLKKDLVVAVVDGARGVGNGLVIPAGPLRAPLAFQLSLADAIVVNQGAVQLSKRSVSDGAHDALRKKFPGPTLEARIGPRADTTWLVGEKVLAFAGIANPDRFYDMLRDIGAVVRVARSFGDHHAFGDQEAKDILANSRAEGLKIVTTDKDWVRLGGFTDARAELQREAQPVPITVLMEDRDRDRLAALLKAVLRKN